MLAPFIYLVLFIQMQFYLHNLIFSPMLLSNVKSIYQFFNSIAKTLCVTHLQLIENQYIILVLLITLAKQIT